MRTLSEVLGYLSQIYHSGGHSEVVVFESLQDKKLIETTLNEMYN